MGSKPERLGVGRGGRERRERRASHVSPAG